MATQVQADELLKSLKTSERELPNGPAAAVLLAGGFAAALLGIIVSIAEIGANLGSSGFLNSLNWYNPVGPLAGKTDIPVFAFFASWAILYALLRNREVNFAKVATASFVMLAIGIVGTFPLFWDMFHK